MFDASDPSKLDEPYDMSKGFEINKEYFFGLKLDGFSRGCSSVTQDFSILLVDGQRVNGGERPFAWFAAKGTNLLIDGLINGQLSILDGVIFGKFKKVKRGRAQVWEPVL